MSDTALLARVRRLFAYDHWANRAAHESLAAMAGPPERAVRWLAHIVGAQWVWLARLRRERPPVAVWPDFPLDRCGDELDRVHAAWSAQLNGFGAGALARVIEYTNTKGDFYGSTAADIIDHVVQHSTYHRGQIASAVRAAGGEPAVTDYIHAARSGLLG